MLERSLSKTGILNLTLSSPPANTLSEAMIVALNDVILLAGEDERVRVVVIGASGKLFSAGHDLKELTAHRQDEDAGLTYYKTIMGACSDLMQVIVSCPKPIIAKVDGLATAAGCQLVASCDLAVASDKAKFCTPGVNIGLFCSTPMVALSRNLSNKQAMEMLLLGEEINAEKALSFGLINKVVKSENLDEEVQKMAETIASKSAHVLKVGKQAFYKQKEMSLSKAYDYCADVMAENMLAKDAQEGIGAILEKRKPKWNDC